MLAGAPIKPDVHGTLGPVAGLVPSGCACSAPARVRHCASKCNTEAHSGAMVGGHSPGV